MFGADLLDAHDDTADVRDTEALLHTFAHAALEYFADLVQLRTGLDANVYDDVDAPTMGFNHGNKLHDRRKLRCQFTDVLGDGIGADVNRTLLIRERQEPVAPLRFQPSQEKQRGEGK